MVAGRAAGSGGPRLALLLRGNIIAYAPKAGGRAWPEERKKEADIRMYIISVHVYVAVPAASMARQLAAISLNTPVGSGDVYVYSLWYLAGQSAWQLVDKQLSCMPQMSNRMVAVVLRGWLYVLAAAAASARRAAAMAWRRRCS